MSPQEKVRDAMDFVIGTMDAKMVCDVEALGRSASNDINGLSRDEKVNADATGEMKGG